MLQDAAAAAAAAAALQLLAHANMLLDAAAAAASKYVASAVLLLLLLPPCSCWRMPTCCLMLLLLSPNGCGEVSGALRARSGRLSSHRRSCWPQGARAAHDCSTCSEQPIWGLTPYSSWCLHSNGICMQQVNAARYALSSRLQCCISSMQCAAFIKTAIVAVLVFANPF
jgi:hypothetical protein